ncbi:endonuclease [Wenzhouxiangella sp. EGI_FJ10409]|uniref:endonuclease n=1 Tax=Wenzhouxiangella sp. EGI_FJ10409 TaxID=3243767 RepID=UPI0035E37E93
MFSCKSGCLAAIVLTLAAPAMGQQVGSGSVSLSASNAQEDFDSLAPSGQSAVLPEGWYFHETDSNADGSYRAGDGSGSSLPGDTYSLGSNGSGERAFGAIHSGSLEPTFGARVRNDSDQTIDEIDVAYVGEQWRLGSSGRIDRLDFQYSLDADSLLDGNATWIDVAGLSFNAPVSTGTAGGLDGNAAANQVAIASTITGLALAPEDTLWIRWRDHDASGADDALGIDDFSLSIAGEPPVDVPPEVSSTQPADGATDIDLDITLEVVFSEAVAVTQGWYSLSCGGTTVPATSGGGPVTHVITPDASLPADQSCVLEIVADNVTDLDGDPDNLEQDLSVGFTTLDPDTLPPPQIESVVPADGSQDVPANTTVELDFSQSVSVTEGAVELSCDESPVAASLGGGNELWVLSPSEVLPYGADCVIEVEAAGVVNQYGHSLDGETSFSFTVIAEPGDGYYSEVNPSSPGQLRCTLHQTIRGHTAFPYSGSGTSTWTILEEAQQDPDDSDRVIDSYRNRSYAKVSDRSGQGGPGPWYNREHTWPNSLGFPSQADARGLPNAPYTDVHMLHLTDQDYNASRGNRPLAYCDSGCSERTTESNQGVGGGSGSYPGNSNWVADPNGNQGSFEVWNHRKGDIARAVLYMAIRYEGGSHPVTGQSEPDLELTNDRNDIQVGTGGTRYMGLLDDLLAWHAADPPSAEELVRNDIVQSYQGNRNPFVDHPEWASPALFTSETPEVCQPAQPDRIFSDRLEATP